MPRGCLFVILLVAAHAHAESYMRFGEKLWMSENGRFFVVIKDDSSKQMRIYERPVGSPSPLAEPHPWTVEKIVADKASKLLRTSKLPQRHLPRDVWVLSRAPITVLFDGYSGSAREDTLVLVGADGAVVWKHDLADFKWKGEFGRFVSRIRWNRGWWVDEARGCVVIGAVGKQYREVDLETGRITHANEAVVLSSLRSESTNVRRAARELSRDAPHLTDSYVEDYIVPGWVGVAFLIGVLATLTGLLLALRNRRRRVGA